MQFNAQSTPSSLRSKVLQASKDAKETFIITASSYEGKCNVTMYNTPPMENITLEVFDEIAQERLNALRIVEELKGRYTYGSCDYHVALEHRLKSLMPIFVDGNGLNNTMLLHWRRRDVIGHFILRLAFCRTPEQMKWFINQEIDLFRFRFRQVNMIGLHQDFLQVNNLTNIQIVQHNEIKDLQNDLEMIFRQHLYAQNNNYYKLKFTDAFDLIRRRKVLLRRGTAYIHSEVLGVILAGLLRAEMMSTMTRAFKHLAMLEEEQRILPRLARLANNAHTGKTYEGDEKGEKITRYQIDQLCKSSFPPCMKQTHQHLRAAHHLRHGARRQYGLFLKGIGLSLEEALAFMREEFTKKIDSDKFEKQYAYNIRHMYGKEGKRVQAAPMACSTIILGNPPSATDCHGCPFKHNEQVLLARRLTSEDLTKEQVNQIIELTKISAYDKACTRFFEFSHKMESGALGQVITHPNQFYELSKEVLIGTRTRDNHLHTSRSQRAEEEIPSNNHGVLRSKYNPYPAPPSHVIYAAQAAENAAKIAAFNTGNSL